MLQNRKLLYFMFEVKMKRLVFFLSLLLCLPNLSLAASYLGEALDGIPLKCTLTTVDNFKAKGITCIFHARHPKRIEVRFNKKVSKFYHFNSNKGKLFDLSRIAIYEHNKHNEQQNFDIFGVLKISPPK